MTRTIGHYQVLEKLGEGGVGVVYAAHDIALGRRVALKLLHDAQGDDRARERMRREARAAASVNHPGVCQAYEVGEEDGEIYLAMELLEGEALAQRLERGALSLDEALAVILEILSALEALHAQGFVHRDLKPSNVFLTKHGVKLLDFGLALPLPFAANADDARLTATGVLVGTPGFMAPEQWRGGLVGPPSDIFAAGALVFEMLTGSAAFKGSSPMEVYHAIAHEQPPVLVGGPSIAAVDRVLQRALAKLPQDRYASAAEMAADLTAARQHASTNELPRARTITRLIVLPFRNLRPDADTEFLSYGLADAVATSLSALESLVVRSSHTAGAPGEGAPDIAAIARAAQVERVLVGTILRVGSRLRVSAQLLDAPHGQLAWCETLDADVHDLFQLQDELARRLVASLAIPLAAGEERGLARARPATAQAYEHYLRANQLSYNSGMLGAARDHYRACLKDDPDFAPAWARLGRVYRVMAKYAHGDVAGDYQQAEQALRRALALDPELSIAHNLFTHYEIEQLGDAPSAMVRLLEQASRRPSDPELFSGLVVACRFCGLLDASVAADRRARRLDPGVRTSVAYTYWMRGDYEEAIRHDDEDMRYVTLYSLPLLGRTDEAIALCREMERDRRGSMERIFVRSTRAALELDPASCRATAQEVLDSRFDDPEGLFYVARTLAHTGEAAMALDMLGAIVNRGLHCPTTFERDPWLDPVRSDPAFTALLSKARAGHAAAAARFSDVAGDRLLVMKAARAQ